jgi:hypothetical protein
MALGKICLFLKGVFDLRNELVHHFLTLHFLYFVYGIEWVDLSPPHTSQTNNYYMHKK